MNKKSQSLQIDLNDWRHVMGRISATFSTPLPAILNMNWDDAIKWWPDALKIEADKAGLYLKG